MIGAAGIRILVDTQVDYGKSRNLALTYRGLCRLVRHCRDLWQYSTQRDGAGRRSGNDFSLVFFVLDKLNLTNDREEEHLYDQP